MPPSTNLGELISERKAAGAIWFALLWPAAAIFGAAGALALNASVPYVTLAGILFAISAVLIFVPLLLPGEVLRFHERGLTQRLPLKGVHVIPYGDIEHMQWRAVRPKVGVAISGELLSPERRIRFNAHVDTGRRAHQQLDSVRNRIATYVAVRLQAKIAAGESLAWGSHRGAAVRLQPNGIAYRPVRFVGTGDEQLLPWSMPLNSAIRDGWCFVFNAGGKDALFSVACEGMDFYPGYLVFKALGQVGEASS